MTCKDHVIPRELDNPKQSNGKVAIDSGQVQVLPNLDLSYKGVQAYIPIQPINPRIGLDQVEDRVQD